jgi:predicted AlkP superfamily phosphohydrolase/phosphomutase
VIAEGGWSSWYHLTFELNPLVKVKAITRCKLLHQKNPFDLYVDFLQIDPTDPMYWQPVARPSSFGADLAKAIQAPYETVGWACMTMPFKDREIDPLTFLEDAEATHAWREKLLFAALARDDWRVLVDVESTPDRVQHMMYQYYDAGHPLHDAKTAAQTTTYFGKTIPLSDAIPATYREMDRVVGEVMEHHLRPGDTLIVCADHGFQSFRRQVHLNNWLAREGFLALKTGIGSKEADYLQFIDWQHTRAYSVGLGMIFVNLQGRERGGIVTAAQVPALLAELREKLLALDDPDIGKPAVHAVYETAHIHSGAYLADEADLMVGFEAGWRVSWATTLGNLALADGAGKKLEPGPVFENNLHNWSGDHVSVAADLVPGVFFCNRKVEIPAGGVNLLHVAPTALSVVGVDVPAQYDLPPLHLAPQ